MLDDFGGGLKLAQKRGNVDATMRGGVRPKPPGRLLELPLAADPVAAAGLVPRDGHMHQTLEEVALGRLGRSPGVFQFLVGGEELAGPDQLQPALERISQGEESR